MDSREKEAPVIIEFGDAYFLNRLIKYIKYDEVLDTIASGNMDSVYALLYYSVLESTAKCHAESWYKYSYCSYLFPKANLASDRISELLNDLGDEHVMQNLLHAHIKYVLESTDDDLCVLIDSTGLPGSYNFPYHGETDQEYRLVTVVQRSTGLPIYLDVVSGKVLDASAMDLIRESLEVYGCHIQYCISDTSCSSVVERTVLAGMDFMTEISCDSTIIMKRFGIISMNLISLITSFDTKIEKFAS